MRGGQHPYRTCCNAVAALLLHPYAVSGSWISAREVWSKRQTGLLVGSKVRSVGQRRDRDELTLVQTGERRVDHVVGGHHPLWRKVSMNVHARLLPQRRRGCSGQHYLHGDTFIRQFVLE